MALLIPYFLCHIRKSQGFVRIDPSGFVRVLQAEETVVPDRLHWKITSVD